MNDRCPTSKFTFEYSWEKINCLNLQISLKDGKLIVDLCFNDANSHQYLQPSPCLLYQCVKKILYSQALRGNCICSKSVLYLLQ